MPHISLLTLSLACSFAAYPAYAYGIYREGARPTRPTWIMILVSDLLLFCFMLSEARFDWLTLGFTAGNILMLALMAWTDLRGLLTSATGPRKRDVTRVALLGSDAWSIKDIGAVAVSCGALALWATSGSGTAAICFSLAGKVAASVPMWVNLHRDPTREKLLPWLLWGLGGALYLMSIPEADWRFASLATPIVFLILELIIIVQLLRRAPDNQNFTPI